MGAVGLEPTRPKGTGFTVQRASQLLITPMKKALRLYALTKHFGCLMG